MWFGGSNQRWEDGTELRTPSCYILIYFIILISVFRVIQGFISGNFSVFWVVSSLFLGFLIDNFRVL
jgi:hypothetical protein